MSLCGGIVLLTLLRFLILLEKKSQNLVILGHLWIKLSFPSHAPPWHDLVTNARGLACNKNKTTTPDCFMAQHLIVSSFYGLESISLGGFL